MKTYLPPILFIILILSCVSPAGRVIQNEPTQWKLVWQEEFDYTGLPNPEFWEFQTHGNSYGWGNGEDQYYTDSRPENAWVQNGHLAITARLENYEPGYSYTSARISTQNRADFLYGRIEVRAKLPEGQGIWPAIWMMPTESYYGGWPNSGELDLMEFWHFKAGESHSNIHTEAYNHKIGTNKGNFITSDTLHSEYHIYSLEWHPWGLSYYFDDQEVFKFDKRSDDPAYWPFDRSFYILLNCAVGGDWYRQNGGIDDSIFPQQFLVDYVRVYEAIYPGEHELELITSEGGTVHVSPQQTSYNPGDMVELTAQASDGYRFLGWSGDIGGTQLTQQVTMGRSKAIEAIFLPKDERMINGDFSNLTNGWSWWVDQANAQAQFLVEDDVMTVDISQRGEHGWQVQLNQEMELNRGSRYVIQFECKSTRPGTINAALVQNYSPYSSYWSRELELTQQWEQFSFDVTIDQNDPMARFELDLAHINGKVFIDNISIREVPLNRDDP